MHFQNVIFRHVVDFSLVATHELEVILQLGHLLKQVPLQASVFVISAVTMIDRFPLLG